jgi:SAM-dependent methyltransferase
LPARAFDRIAPTFDRHRALPAGVAEAVRAAVIEAADAHPASRYLDVGAGSGRFGAAFVAAGDDYVGIDRSAGMLHVFAQRAVQDARAPRLVQADGTSLPFRDRTFDIVLLMNVFGGLRDWRELAAEAQRTLRPGGAVVVGRTTAPPDGLDARMKQRAKEILQARGVGDDRVNRRDEVVAWLNARAALRIDVIAARWTAQRTPRDFIERHRNGARFALLSPALQAQAAAELSAWAAAEFGSLDSAAIEAHALELSVVTLHSGAAA